MAPASIKVNVELPALPELGARLFVNLEPEQQARMLSMIWDAMRGEHGGAIGAADRCNQIKAESTFDREARNFLLNLLPRAEQPKTYTVEKTHDDGTVSVASGLTADEVLASYLNDNPDSDDQILPDGGWPKRDRLPREGEDIEDRARNKSRNLARSYGMGAEKMMKALLPPTMSPDEVREQFAGAYIAGYDSYRGAWPADKGFVREAIDRAVRHKVAEDEHAIIEKIGRELGPVVTVTVNHRTQIRDRCLGELGATEIRHPVRMQPDVVVKLRPARPMNLNDDVQIDGLPVGTVTKVNSDGTVEVLMRGYFAGGEVKRGAAVFGETCKHDFGAPLDRGQAREDWTDTCPDCKGSGEYRGFTTVEPCTRCDGRGKL